jgi:hypothetical protein
LRFRRASAHCIPTIEREEKHGYKIAIMGPGAVGAYAGAHMARAGEDVTFIDSWPENVETMKAQDLKVSHIRDVPEWSTPVRALHLTELQQDYGNPMKYEFDPEKAKALLKEANALRGLSPSASLPLAPARCSHCR